MNNKKLGGIGETLASRMLKKKGYELLCMNYRCKIGEIDLIAKDKEYIVFIEVKTRNSLAYGLPSEAVTPWKQKTIAKVAQHYLKKHHIYDQAVRFDVIEIYIDKEKKSWYRHIENGFEIQ